MITGFFKRKGRFASSLFFLLAALVMSGMPAAPASSFELIIGAGPDGSFSRHSGKLLCRIFTRHDKEISCSLSDAGDPIDNLTNVQGGSLDLAFIDSLLLEEATTGKGAFEYLDIAYDRIRIVTPLYEVPLTLIVRNDAGISSVDQLPGKRVNAGSFGSPEKHLFELFMQARGWTAALFPVFAGLPSSLSQDTIALNHGDVQVLVHKGVHPDTNIQRLLEDSEVSLVGFSSNDLDNFIISNPALSKQYIKKSTYPSLPDNLTTFGTTMALVASADMDDETVRSIVAALEQSRQSLQTMHPALSSFHIDRKPQWFGSIKAHKAVLE